MVVHVDTRVMQDVSPCKLCVGRFRILGGGGGGGGGRLTVLGGGQGLEYWGGGGQGGGKFPVGT